MKIHLKNTTVLESAIDRLVYELYGLNKADKKEVKTWYARRYPKLARFTDIDSG